MQAWIPDVEEPANIGVHNLLRSSVRSVIEQIAIPAITFFRFGHWALFRSTASKVFRYWLLRSYAFGGVWAVTPLYP